MRRVLFIGGFVPRAMLRTVVEDTYGKVGFSNHNFEMSLIRGLAEAPGVKVEAISAPKVYSYPHNNRNRTIRSERYADGDVEVSSIGYFNRSGINIVCRTWQLTCAILRSLREAGEEEVAVVVNTPAPEHLVAVRAARLLTRRKFTSALVVPDVPECFAEILTDRRGMKARVLDVLTRFRRRLSRRMDRMVYLTAAMNDYYRMPADRWIVMEGLIDERRAYSAGEGAEKDTAGKPRETILYTGTLRKIFGVMDLVDMFEKGNFEGCELRICGSGEAEAEIRERAKANPAIKFLGSLSPEEALREQARATILVNPRNSSGDYTRYSFPSKTIEYLLAGRTVVANRLPGIPEEYDEYIFYPRAETAEAWIECLREVMAMDPAERRRHDEAGRQFILTHKTAAAQAKRILALIDRK